MIFTLASYIYNNIYDFTYGSASLNLAHTKYDYRLEKGFTSEKNGETKEIKWNKDFTTYPCNCLNVN